MDNERYFEVLAELNQPMGRWQDGEIEIITDPDLMKQAEEKSGQVVGVVDEDPYVIHLRDAVWLPPGPGKDQPTLGTYIRFVYAYELKGNLGVFTLPVNTDGRIVFNLTFRHAPRRWTLEGSGTIAEAGESLPDTIQRCMQSELGCEIIEHRELTDKFIPERGLLGGLVPIYCVKVDFQPKSVADPTVRGHLLMTPEQFWQEAVAGGSVTHDGREYFCCDGYTIAAVTLAERAGLLTAQWN